jgi:hypothetical protein
MNVDMLQITETLKRIGFTESAVSDLAPKGAVGFRAYPNQFTVLHPEAEKKTISISFGEGNDKFSLHAAAVYRQMVDALRERFGAARIVGPNALDVEVRSNSALHPTGQI